MIMFVGNALSADFGNGFNGFYSQQSVLSVTLWNGLLALNPLNPFPKSVDSVLTLIVTIPAQRATAGLIYDLGHGSVAKFASIANCVRQS